MKPTPTYPLTPMKIGVHLPHKGWRKTITDFLQGPIRRWIPIFIGMSGVVLVGCNGTTEIGDKSLVCKHELQGYENMPLSIRLYDEAMTGRISKKAEVSYGISPKAANYLETDARYTVTLLENENFPECVITIDRVSGFAKHLCLGDSVTYPNDPRGQTFELTCSSKVEKI